MKPSAALLSMIFVTACASDGTEQDALGLGALEGSYDLTETVADHSELGQAATPTCRLEVRGSRVTADCEKTFEDQFETLSIEVVLGESEIAGELVYVSGESEIIESSCYLAGERTTTVVGSARKQSGAMVRGVLAPLAGEWTGDLTIEVEYDLEPVSGAPDWCAIEDELYGYRFDASVGGTQASITWTTEGESGALEVIASESAISVNGGVVTK